MTDWSQAFLGVIAVATAVMAVMQIGAIVVLARVALQVRDWAPDVQNSAEFFLGTPTLAEWLQAGYHHTPGPAGYDVWIRRAPAP